MSEINSFIGIHQMNDIHKLIEKQRINAQSWQKSIGEMKAISSLEITINTKPNNWVYGILSENKVATIKKFREQGFYATSVHINNNIYSIFDNKTNLIGVNEFMSHFVALPCGWWFNFNKE